MTSELAVNTPGGEKNQTGSSGRPVLLPLVHVSLQRSEPFLLWAVLRLPSPHSSCTLPFFFQTTGHLCQAFHCNLPILLPPICSTRRAISHSLCCVLPDGGLLCTAQSSPYESLTRTQRPVPLVRVGRAAVSDCAGRGCLKIYRKCSDCSGGRRTRAERCAATSDRVDWLSHKCVDGSMLLRWMCWKNQYLHRLVGLPAHCCSSSS